MRKQRWTVLILAVTTAFITFGAQAGDGDFAWARAMGGTGNEQGTGIAVDFAGNVYTVGRFAGTVDYDPGPGTFNLTSAGDNDIFISKLDSAGNFVWAKSFGGTYDDEGHDIAVDSVGSVYTTGWFVGTVDFDPGPGTCNLFGDAAEIFVLKLDSAGNFVWAKSMGGGMADAGNGIAVDSAGNVYTTGFFNDSGDFDPGPGTFTLTAIPGFEFTTFISKLDRVGNFVWAKALGGATLYTEGGKDIAVDSAGNVYTTGWFFDTVDFDPGPGIFNLTASPVDVTDVFVLKLDSAGNFVWARSMGGVGHEYAYGIALDNAGNVYTTGCYWDTADFDPGPGVFNLPFMGTCDIFVSKLDNSGNFVWAKAMGGSSYDYGKGIAVDRAGNVYTTGYFGGTVDFDPGPGAFNLDGPNFTNIVVSKLDSAGNFVWAKGMAGTDSNEGSGIAVDRAGDVHITGLFAGAADFDPGSGTFNLNSKGGTDVFVSKLSGPPPNATAIIPRNVGPTSAESISFAVIFDKPVQGFDDDTDLVLTLTGSVAFTDISISGSDSRYTVTVGGISGTGTLRLSVSTLSDVEDLAGTPLAGSVTSAVVTIDPGAPGLPLVALPLGLALLSAGVAVVRGRRKD